MGGHSLNIGVANAALIRKTGREERPTFVVTPNPSYLQIFRRETLPAEAHSLNEGD